MSEGKLTFEGWMNKPSDVIMKDGTVTVRVPTNTDDCPSAPFCWQTITGDFQITVFIRGDLHEHDKAGIMIRVDEQHWIMTGMECCHDGKVNHTTTVALADTSRNMDGSSSSTGSAPPNLDWSVALLPDEATAAEGVWFCFKRLGNAYECFHSMDARKWIQTRQGQFLDSCTLYAGITCASPKSSNSNSTSSPNGRTEFSVTFESYVCTDRVI